MYAGCMRDQQLKINLLIDEYYSPCTICTYLYFKHFYLTEIFAYKEDIAVLPADIAGRGVDVGVVGLLQSVDG